jgi:uncharacterized FlaG/YvyC family protein
MSSLTDVVTVRDERTGEVIFEGPKEEAFAYLYELGYSLEEQDETEE